MDIGENVPIDSNDLITDVFFIDENTGWITTLLAKKVFFTNDGGVTFTPQDTEYNTQLTTIFMINENFGFCAGYSGIVYKTTNGGADWKYHGTMGDGTITDIDFPPNPTMESTGYLTGQNGSVYRISDSGINKIELNIASDIDAVSMISENEAWICGEYVIRHLIDDVDQRDQSYSHDNHVGIYFLPGTKTGFAVGDAGMISKTTNGMDWQTKKNPVYGELTLYDVFFLDENNGWAVGNKGTILKSTDLGETWIKEESGTKNTLGKVFPIRNIVYACGGERTLLKYSELTEVDDNIHEPILSISPNPARDYIDINFEKCWTSEEEIEIYNILGEKVASESIHPPAGSHRMNISNLPAGLYYIRIGNYSDKFLVMR